MNFFSFLLLQQPTFDWAKDFVQSKAWDFFATGHSSNSTVFSLPSVYLDITLSACQNFEQTSFVVLEMIDDEDASDVMELLNSEPKVVAPKKRKTRAKGKALVSEDDVRRSTRLKMLRNGFTSSSCKNKNCLGCSANPPAISRKVIRNLGTSFYDLDPEDLTLDKLNAPRKQTNIKKGKEKPTSASHDDVGDANDDGDASDAAPGPQQFRAFLVSFLCVFMAFRTWKILSQNVRGVNSDKKQDAVRYKVLDCSYDIICLQKTKKQSFDIQFVNKICPSIFDAFDYIPSQGASGGSIVIWKSYFLEAQEFSKMISISLQNLPPISTMTPGSPLMSMLLVLMG